MTLRHYEIFKSIADTGSFRKAAEKLFITQSAVSHVIRELETRTGTRLFERYAKGVLLTRSGQLLLEEITPILAACMALETHIGCLEMKAPIYLVSSITIANYFLPAVLKEFQQKWPDITVQVEVVSAAMALGILKEGKADIALIEGNEPQTPLCGRVFSGYGLKFVCASDYFLSVHELSVEEFCAQRLLLRERGSAIRDTLDSALFLLGHQLTPVWSSVNSSALIAAARAGLGIAVLPDLLVEEDLSKGKLICVSVSGLSLENQMLAVWHRDKYLTEPLLSLLSLL